MNSEITKENRKRAEYAFCEVKEFQKERKNQYIDEKNQNKEQDEENKAGAKYQESLKKYKSYTRRIPTLIMTSGLLATMTFIRSKNDEYEKIYKSVYKWIMNKYRGDSFDNEELKKNDNTFIENIIKMNDAEYRIITNEILEFMVWMKRFASNIEVNQKNK